MIPDCLRCQTPMEPGFQVDDVDRGTFRQAQWIKGEAKCDDSTFLGLKLMEDWVVKVDKEALKPIVTWRCPACGYLEQFAP